MSNVEVVRGIADGFGSQDVERLLRHLDPQIEWNMPPVLPEEAG